MAPRATLKARAIALLAQREQSRSELRRKLLSHASADPGGAQEATDPAQVIDALLDWLEAHGHLSAARFAESRVRARAARYGNERIRQELAQHGVALDAQALRALKDSELERARAVWLRKFGSAAPDAELRARQARFLARRGFSGDVIRRVVKGLGDD